MSWVLWITGLPGSGKTTLARLASHAVAARGIATTVLSAAAVRETLLPEGGSQRDEEIVHRALVYTAKRLSEAGIRVIIDAAGPRRAWRQAARKTVPHFAEVQLLCPPEVAGDRERATRWKLGGEPAPVSPPSCPGRCAEILLDYECSLNAELTIRTDVASSWTARDLIMILIGKLERLAGCEGELKGVSHEGA